MTQAMAGALVVAVPLLCWVLRPSRKGSYRNPIGAADLPFTVKPGRYWLRRGRERLPFTLPAMTLTAIYEETPHA